MKGKHRMKHIALVVPSYNEEECVSLLYERVREVFEKETEYDFSIFFPQDAHRKIQSSGLPGYHKLVLKVPAHGTPSAKWK